MLNVHPPDRQRRRCAVDPGAVVRAGDLKKVDHAGYGETVLIRPYQFEPLSFVPDASLREADGRLFSKRPMQFQVRVLFPQPQQLSPFRLRHRGLPTKFENGAVTTLENEAISAVGAV